MIVQTALVSPRSHADRHQPDGVGRLTFANRHDHLNHRVFRYPAKFHPPVARALIETFSAPGEIVLDPFCGCGTTLDAALAAGRSVVFSDVDPLAVLVTTAKIDRFDHDGLKDGLRRMKAILADMRKADIELWGPLDGDITQSDYQAAVQPLSENVPALPRLHHWFRRRAIIQLAAMRALVEAMKDERLRSFLRLCFAATIRNSSNADPVPVSGLEVTSHMLRKEAEGRIVDPYALMIAAIDKTGSAQRAFQAARRNGPSARTAIADARDLGVWCTGRVDCVVTSPPYLTAVDYYRRHTLEMYWLGLTADVLERQSIMSGYIGRDRVGACHLDAGRPHGTRVAERWLAGIPAVRPERARAFHHYCTGIDAVFERMAAVVKPGGNVVFVVGDVRFCGAPISMAGLLQEIAEPHLALSERLWYPISNRYMSYSRKNAADINVDHVLVFRRKR